MTTSPSPVALKLTDAIVARDFAGARELLHPDIDFRAMTPNRIWEADGPGDVESHLRAWLADPGEKVTGVEATEPELVEDTLRVGWRVRGIDGEGPFVYEQQAYVREDEGRVTWMRVFCSGFRRPDGA